MRVVFLIAGLLSFLLLIIFTVENVSWYASYNLFSSLNQTGIVAIPIIVGGLFGLIAGFFFALFVMTKQTGTKDNDDWQ
ncbi:MAG: hypothetical protein NTZ80_04285 [Patescibacteria group bacterium]|nr:hypothetical protein [Patescibacteria group bacterium]